MSVQSRLPGESVGAATAGFAYIESSSLRVANDVVRDISRDTLSCSSLGLGVAAPLSHVLPVCMHAHTWPPQRAHAPESLHTNSRMLTVERREVGEQQAYSEVVGGGGNIRVDMLGCEQVPERDLGDRHAHVHCHKVGEVAVHLAALRVRARVHVRACIRAGFGRLPTLLSHERRSDEPHGCMARPSVLTHPYSVACSV